MNRNEMIEIIKVIGNDTIDHLPDLLEPFQPFGRSLGALVQVIRNGAKTISEVGKECDIEDALQELREKYEKMKKPTYMECALFASSKGKALKQEQKERLEAILRQEIESVDTRSLQIIDEFVRQYMGGEIEVGNVDECEIGDTFVNFQFCCYGGYDEYPYHEEDLNLVMSALNSLLGEDYFDYYLVDGHDESWLDE